MERLTVSIDCFGAAHVLQIVNVVNLGVWNVGSYRIISVRILIFVAVQRIQDKRLNCYRDQA